MRTSSRQMQGLALYALGVGAFATMDAFAKYLSGAYPVAEIILIRALFGYLPILLQYRMGTARGAQAMRSARPLLQLLRGGCVLAAGATFFVSLSGLSLADATAISLAAPVFMALFGITMLREPAGWETYVTIAVALAGGLLIVRPTDGMNVYALIAVVSALFYALGVVATRRAGQVDPPVVTAIWGNTVMLVGSAAWMLHAGWVWPVAGDWLPFIGVGLAGGVANLLYIGGLRLSGVSDVAVIDYSIFAWAAAFSILVFHEDTPALSLAGAGLIVCSGVYSAVAKWLRSHDKPAKAPLALGMGPTS
ncbi:MAG: DMT family transporter [Inquilinus limosus]|uniref:DMT family transporter n=1 Tax=Inquilinus limosus TaxID=171674 RepID=A0A952FQM2_9PROT|nr:DMT family transporter [Inquilinus limosus]